MCGGLLRSACYCAMIAFVMAGAASAEPKKLSKDEASAGWINLFDGETTFGFNQTGDAKWAVEDGAIVCANGTGGALATTSQFADFVFSAKVRVSSEDIAGIAVRASLEGHPTENGSAMLVITEPKDGGKEWHTVEITANGADLTAKLDGKDVELKGSTRGRGYIAFFYYGHGDRSPKPAGWDHRIKLEVADAKLQPLNLKSLFNGKDLAGWSEIPEHKSKFSVIDGALNIKDGNGQIETTELFKDFALQLDIISNGEHLNSGVFYRGPVGVFWKGYESQVRNQWKDNDRTQPIDFGTGGNYGNQPSRNVITTDGEWFTKTIVCSGNHTSVWLNGYHVSDFTDNRPLNPGNDGKNGYVPGPGTFHLQGHDPTTDLSFKNIKAAEYPKN
ncbi:MAG: DUF1080 domain-containing protein [Candidatus Hydrogenedentes bacterium]|nr:DUF1080 domain-containing protein [Candidatus Hydrogenedentota bacterium]